MLCKRILISLGAAALVMPLIHCGSKTRFRREICSRLRQPQFPAPGKPRVQGFHRPPSPASGSV